MELHIELEQTENNFGEGMKFRKKPVVVEAKQLNNHTDLMEIVHWAHKGLHPAHDSIMINNGHGLTVRTLEGEMHAIFGDWIIKEPFPTGDRQFYPCKSDIFEATYEQVEEPILLKDTMLGGIENEQRREPKFKTESDATEEDEKMADLMNRVLKYELTTPEKERAELLSSLILDNPASFPRAYNYLINKKRYPKVKHFWIGVK